MLPDKTNHFMGKIIIFATLPTTKQYDNGTRRK